MSNIHAYNGKGKFIFVSYSHRDTDTVLPFIEELQKSYNVWFDEGIHFGKEWEDEIADKLLSCDLFIFMVSEASLKSANCKDEIHMAREKGKHFLNVMMAPTQVPDSFALRYSRFQTCKLYTYSNFANAIKDMHNKCEWFKYCMIDPNERPHADPIPVVDKPVQPAPQANPQSQVKPQQAEPTPTVRQTRPVEGGPTITYVDVPQRGKPQSRPQPQPQQRPAQPVRQQPVQQARPVQQRPVQPAPRPEPKPKPEPKERKFNYFRDVMFKDKFFFIFAIIMISMFLLFAVSFNLMKSEFIGGAFLITLPYCAFLALSLPEKLKKGRIFFRIMVIVCAVGMTILLIVGYSQGNPNSDSGYYY